MRALLLVLLVAACQNDAGPKIALRYHPPTGAVYRYALEQTTRLDMPEASGPLAGVSRQGMRLRIYSTQTIQGPVDGGGGGIEVQIVMDSASLVMPNVDMSRQLAQLRGSRSTAVMKARCRTATVAMSRKRLVGTWRTRGKARRAPNRIASLPTSTTRRTTEDPRASSPTRVNAKARAARARLAATKARATTNSADCR